jgi:hypothetical protein
VTLLLNLAAEVLGAAGLVNLSSRFARLVHLAVVALALGGCSLAAQQSATDALVAAAKAHSYPLDSTGRAFLLREAAGADFFLLGEIHGDNDVPELIAALWPAMWQLGYRHAAAEVSPWAADQLEQAAAKSGPAIGLWTPHQTAIILAPAGHAGVVWGCDIEEVQPQQLIRELTRLNPDDSHLQQMAALTAAGYRRSQAPQLLQLLAATATVHDAAPGGISLRHSLDDTLRVESERLDRGHILTAQQDREDVMKRQFLAHYEAGSPGKVFLRFGQAHLFRGYDLERGVSTLGDFVSQFAIARHSTAFNVAAFGAGGSYRLNGVTSSADQTGDEPGLGWLARIAPGSATVFDTRPLRALLHAIPEAQRTAEERSLIDWVDGYDALICFRNVTPLDAAH